MEQKYIDLVINRLTQAQYDELKRNNQISEEELYEIVDHDDLFYYKTQLYTKTEIETKLSGVLSTLRGEIASEKATLSSLISGNTTQINSLRSDLVSTNNSLSTTNSNLSSFKTTVANTYATKTELNNYSPVEANPTLYGYEDILESISIDGVEYQIYPEGEIEFNTTQSTATNAAMLGSIKVGNDIWNIPTGSTGNLDNYYTKPEVDLKIAEAVTDGKIDLSGYYTKEEVDEAIESVDVSSQLTAYAKTADVYTKTQIDNKGFLTEHQSLDGYATENYVNTKVSDLVNSAPGALDTLKELSTALGDDPNFATTITNQLALKANASDVYTKSQVDTAISNVEVDLSGYYTKTEIDNKDFTNVMANPELTGNEVPLTSISIKGVNYTLEEEGNELILSDEEVEGASKLASISINGDNWNIVGKLSAEDMNKFYQKDEVYNKGEVYAKTETYNKTQIENLINEVDVSEQLSSYYTKTETDGAISTEIAKVIGAAPEAYNTLKEIADYIESDLDVGAQLEASIASKANSVDVYTKSEANGKFALKENIPEPTDLTNYYTKQETVDVIDKITGLDNYYDKGEIDTKVQTLTSSKQDTLVSGTNIKTVNGMSLLGEGNIVINEGTGGGENPGGGGNGTYVVANPDLTGDEEALRGITIADKSYSVSAESFSLSDVPTETEYKLATIQIGDDQWSVVSEAWVNQKFDTKETELKNYTDTAVANLINSAPETLDTLGEISTLLQENDSLIDGLLTEVGTKANAADVYTKTETDNKYVEKITLDANPLVSEITPRLESLRVNGTDYVVSPDVSLLLTGTVDADGKKTVTKMTVNDDVWHMPVAGEPLPGTGNVDLTGYATENWVKSQGYLTEHQSLDDYALKSEIPEMVEVPTNVSEFTNDAGYITSTSLNGLATESYVDTKVASLVDNAPETLNTLNELATAINEHEHVYDALLETVGNKADRTELFSGSYNDLTDKPTIPTTFSYNDLTDKPDIPNITYSEEVPEDTSTMNTGDIVLVPSAGGSSSGGGVKITVLDAAQNQAINSNTLSITYPIDNITSFPDYKTRFTVMFDIYNTYSSNSGYAHMVQNLQLSVLKGMGKEYLWFNTKKITNYTGSSATDGYDCYIRLEASDNGLILSSSGRSSDYRFTTASKITKVVIEEF